MKRALEQIVKRPFAAFVSGVEMLGQRASGWQTIDGILSRFAHTLSHTPGRKGRNGNATAVTDRDVQADEPDTPASVPVVTISNERVRTEAPVNANDRYDKSLDEETEQQRDTNLQDNTLKLVRFKILFVKRDYEATFTEKEELIADNLSEATFTTWKIAEFMQQLDQIEIPRVWREKNYPRREIGPEGMICSLPDEDKKYLRVFYEVMARYVRQKKNYKKLQLNALGNIRDAIRDSRGKADN